MVWILYNVLFSIGFAVMLPYFIFRMCRRGGYAKGFMQRLGVYGRTLRNRIAERPRVWIHAVSVGEVYVALRLLAGLRARRPQIGFVLTTTTSTGHRIAAQQIDKQDVLLYFPVDFPPIVRLVLNRIRPLAIVLTECEMWPNLIRLAARRNIPVALVNGRISASSFRGYRKMRFFFKRALRAMRVLLVQEEIYAERLLRLGADPAQIHVVGTAKYDVIRHDPEGREQAGRTLRAVGVRPDDLVLVGGSTWEGEEAVLLEIYRRIRPDMPTLRMVLVPRHFERVGAVVRTVQNTGLSFVKKSALDAGQPPPDACPDVFVIDTTGELMSFYAHASVIFVGKSLAARGGQNIIEPASWGKPVLVGPHTENFEAVMRDFLDADAICQVRDQAGLEAKIRFLFENPAEREAMGRRAASVVDAKRGAIEASVERIAPLIPERRRS